MNSLASGFCHSTWCLRAASLLWRIAVVCKDAFFKLKNKFKVVQPFSGWKALDTDNFIKWTLIRLLKEKMGIWNSGILGRTHEGRNVDWKSGNVYLATQMQSRIVMEARWTVGEVGAGALWCHRWWNARFAQFLSHGVCIGESLLGNMDGKSCCHPSWFWKMTRVIPCAFEAT